MRKSEHSPDEKVEVVYDGKVEVVYELCDDEGPGIAVVGCMTRTTAAGIPSVAAL